MNFKITYFILIIFPTFAFSKDVQSANLQSIHSLPSTIIIGQGQHDQPTFYALNTNGQVSEVNMGFIDSAVSAGIAEAKKATCSLKVKPDQITVSVGIFSATWETKKFCE
jgi:hypothetical protein